MKDPCINNIWQLVLLGIEDLRQTCSMLLDMHSQVANGVETLSTDPTAADHFSSMSTHVLNQLTVPFNNPATHFALKHWLLLCFLLFVSAVRDTISRIRRQGAN